MSDNMKTHKVGLGLEGQSADPSNPKDGDMHYSDGTARDKGPYMYYNSTWNKMQGAAVENAVFSDVQTSGTNGGTATTGSWTAMVLNTQKGSLGTLSSNQITLDAGDYLVDGYCTFGEVDLARIRLRDNTGNVTYALSALIQENSNAPGNFVTCPIIDRFTLAGTVTLDFEYYVATTKATDGLGRGYSAPSESEIFRSLKITKV